MRLGWPLDGALSLDPDRPEAHATLGAVQHRSTFALPQPHSNADSQRFRNQNDGHTKMLAERWFLDFRGGEENRNALYGGKEAGNVGSESRPVCLYPGAESRPLI